MVLLTEAAEAWSAAIALVVRLDWAVENLANAWERRDGSESIVLG